MEWSGALFSPRSKKLEKKNSNIFSEKSFLIFREMELFKKTSYISAANFPRSKNKKDQPSKNFSYFLKKNFSYISANGTF